jgi:hypothetical protein
VQDLPRDAVATEILRIEGGSLAVDETTERFDCMMKVGVYGPFWFAKYGIPTPSFSVPSQATRPPAFTTTRSTAPPGPGTDDQEAGTPSGPREPGAYL